MHTFGALHDDGTIEVTFTTDEADPEVDVLLDVDFLFFAAWPDVDHLRLRGGARRSVTVRLPADVELSYGFVRRPRSAAGDGSDDALRSLRSHPDPDVAEQIVDAFSCGSAASLLHGPRCAPPHPAFTATDVVRPSRARLPLADRTVTVVHGPATDRLVLLLDGDVWTATPALLQALQRWTGPDTAFLVVPTPDRGILADRERIGALVADTVLPAVEDLLGVHVGADRVAIAGQSFGGLGAASLVADRGDRIGVGIVSSGSFWWRAGPDLRDLDEDSPEPGDLSGSLAAQRLDHARFYVHVGREESAGMVQQSRRFTQIVRGAGATAEFSVHPGGHDHAWYRHAILAALDAWVAWTSPRTPQLRNAAAQRGR